MKNEKLLREIGNIEDELILDAVKDTKKKSSWKKWVALVAAFALVITGTVAFMKLSEGDKENEGNKISSGSNENDNNGSEQPATPMIIATVALDVNPSVEIEVRDDEKVAEVNPLNKDAEVVLGDMDFENVDIDVAVNAIVGSMLKNGYLSVDNNSILVSVAAEDDNLSARLQSDISKEIDDILAGSNINASVMTQEYEKNEQADHQAKEYEVSQGKAQLISKIIEAGLKNAKGEAYTYEELMMLNINELKMILESKEMKVEGVETSGQASGNKYISQDEVLGIVYKAAGVTKDEVKNLEVEMDYDDGAMLYEIEFVTAKAEYDYEVDAKTGKIVDSEVEPLDSDDRPNQGGSEQTGGNEGNQGGNGQTGGNAGNQGENGGSEQPTSNITKDEALNIAYKAAGVKAAQVTRSKCVLDRDDGRAVYEIEFETASKEYDYEIDAKTGKVLDSDVEAKDTDDDFDDWDDDFDDDDDDDDWDD